MNTKELQSQIESLRRELDAATHEIDRLRLRIEASRNYIKRTLSISRALAGCCQEHECLLDGTQRKDG